MSWGLIRVSIISHVNFFHDGEFLSLAGVHPSIPYYSNRYLGRTRFNEGLNTIVASACAAGCAVIVSTVVFVGIRAGTAGLGKT